MRVKVVNYKEPKDLLGKAVAVYLRDGRDFYFKIMECGPDYIGGYDDEGLNQKILLKDIDFVLRW